MIFSNTAVSSLSSLLVVAAAATTSVVGGATTKNRKLSKNSPPSPPMTKCPSATLYYDKGWSNEVGSQNIQLITPANTPIDPSSGIGVEALCSTRYGYPLCIGDTVAQSRALYSDAGLTNKVGFLSSVSIISMVEEDGGYGKMVTASVLYENGTELNFGGYLHEDEYTEVGRGADLAVSGGTGDCALNMGLVDSTYPANLTYGLLEFHDMTDMNMMMDRVRSLL